MRTSYESFWSDRIMYLQERYSEKFRMTYVYTREVVEGHLSGRLTAEILYGLTIAQWQQISNTTKACEVDEDVEGKQCTSPSETQAEGEGFDKNAVRFLTVGTKQLMREAEKMIGEMGYPMPDHGLFRY
jgi:hypothetical protein